MSVIRCNTNLYTYNDWVEEVRLRKKERKKETLATNKLTFRLDMALFQLLTSYSDGCNRGIVINVDCAYMTTGMVVVAAY
jgi:hypothetical protein